MAGSLVLCAMAGRNSGNMVSSDGRRRGRDGAERSLQA